MTTLLTLSEAAAFFHITPCTLRIWRKQRGFPRPMRLQNGALRYQQKDLDAYLRRLETQNEIRIADDAWMFTGKRKAS